MISKSNTEDNVNVLKTSLNRLAEISKELYENVAVSGDISNKLTVNFQGLEANIESQAEFISGVNLKIDKESKYINSVAKRSNAMKDLSESTVSMTEACNQSILSLSEEMKKVAEGVEDTVKLVNSLKDQTNNIESILVSVNGISQQINLLALNAAIEAARAGEQGKGFSVVADEIRKLAEQSQNSNLEISTILGELKNQATDTSNHIVTLQVSTKTSNSSVKVVNDAFDNINSNSKELVTKAAEIDTMTTKIQRTFSEMLSNVQEISQSANITSKSIEENIVRFSEQNERVSHIEKLAGEIKNITI